jgi:hypothetical protein
VQCSRSCAHIPHGREVFEEGFGEGLFSKSPSSIKKLGNLFSKKVFPYFSFREKKSKTKENRRAPNGAVGCAMLSELCSHSTW